MAAGGRVIDFSGWLLPVQYKGIIDEHNAVRNAVGIFDTCHMGRFILEGSTARADLSRLISCDVESLKPMRCRYGFFLNEAGGILDDVIVYNLDNEKFMVVANAGTRSKDEEWIAKHIQPDTTFKNVSDEMGKVDMQGPQSTEIISKLLNYDFSSLKYFGCQEIDALGTKMIVSRSGYTGETGYEIYADAAKMEEIWDVCVSAGATQCGLGARDTLRLESALPLYGHELSENVTPVEAVATRYAGGKDYIGKAAVEKIMKEGPKVLLAGFRIEGRRSARHGDPVLFNGEEAGKVTSGSFAPTLGCSIGFAYVKPELASIGTSLEINTGRAVLEGKVVELPFVSKRSK